MAKEQWFDNISAKPTIIVQRTLRSGQNVNYDGNVVVLGDVNPGAEIVASGHVVVMGSLRGLVHAGATGEDSATVTALSLNPTQLRISSHITRPPDGSRPENSICPEIARIKEGAVVIEKYQAPK
ncbi:MAG: septum site-determining protein MinC [Clostridiales bacterium]|jgi:septum site-determining protein MinC|nr:septum site-determining protein MinC [Clostridiales bacterium]MDR2712820.1 septum site-determining protein MinC [Clostridiales bacterium]